MRVIQIFFKKKRHITKLFFLKITYRCWSIEALSLSLSERSCLQLLLRGCLCFFATKTTKVHSYIQPRKLKFSLQCRMPNALCNNHITTVPLSLSLTKRHTVLLSSRNLDFLSADTDHLFHLIVSPGARYPTGPFFFRYLSHCMQPWNSIGSFNMSACESY